MRKVTEEDFVNESLRNYKSYSDWISSKLDYPDIKALYRTLLHFGVFEAPEEEDPNPMPKLQHGDVLIDHNQNVFVYDYTIVDQIWCISKQRLCLSHIDEIHRRINGKLTMIWSKGGGWKS